MCDMYFTLYSYVQSSYNHCVQNDVFSQMMFYVFRGVQTKACKLTAPSVNRINTTYGIRSNYQVRNIRAVVQSTRSCARHEEYAAVLTCSWPELVGLVPENCVDYRRFMGFVRSQLVRHGNGSMLWLHNGCQQWRGGTVGTDVGIFSPCANVAT